MLKRREDLKMCCLQVWKSKIAMLILIFLWFSLSLQVETVENFDRTPKINVILLDEGSIGLPAGSEVRRNDWQEWENRLPTFLGKLQLVADFRRASDEKPAPEASLYTLEITSSLSPDRIEEIVATELQRIYEATRRPSAILARSSSGRDQLRIVFQDSRDYPPAHAAKFLRVLAEISPAIAERRIAENFGPFNAPPTLVFDPRTTILPPVTGDASSYQWRVLEESYLLPHYVLHALTILDENVRLTSDTFYLHSIAEPGSLAMGEFKSDLYIAGAGINSPADSSIKTDVLQMAVSRSGRECMVVPVYLKDWKARGLDLSNPQSATEFRTYSSMCIRRAQSERKDIVFDVRPDLSPYQPLGSDTVDYLSKSPIWKSESALYALAVDSISNGFRDANTGGRSHALVHSEGGYAISQTKCHFDSLDLFKVRVGSDMIVPRIQEIRNEGGDVRIWTGKGDYWSLSNSATKSIAQDIARKTGSIAIHDDTWRGHGLPLEKGRFEVFSGETNSVAKLVFDPTQLSGSGEKMLSRDMPGPRPLDPKGEYIIYKVNNEVADWFKGIGTAKPSNSPLSHSFLAVFDRNTRKVVETYSYTNTHGGTWEDPQKEQNMLGAEAAINQHLDNKGPLGWTAKEMSRGNMDLVNAHRIKFAERKAAPASFARIEKPETWATNCKTVTNNLSNDAIQLYKIGGGAIEAPRPPSWRQEKVPDSGPDVKINDPPHLELDPVPVIYEGGPEAVKAARERSIALDKQRNPGAWGFPGKLTSGSGQSGFDRVKNAPILSLRPGTNKGGIDFTKGNIYFLDLTGVVRRLGDMAQATLDDSGGVGGEFEESGKTQKVTAFPMGYGRKGAPLKTAGELLLFHKDVFEKDAGCLPFALPRIWEPDMKNAPVFGGGWTFEPLVMEGTNNLNTKAVTHATRKIIVNPLETGNHLYYLIQGPGASGSKKGAAVEPSGSSVPSFTPEGGDFQPDLLANEDGTFFWVLRHGVTIVFDKNGLVQEIRGPDGERVDYVRAEGGIIEEKSSDNRSGKIEFVHGEPISAAFSDSVPVEYGYKSKRLQEVKSDGKGNRFVYDEDGRLAKIEASDGAVDLKHDSQGRLIEIVSLSGKVSLNHPSGTTLRITDGERNAVDWRFGPKRLLVGVTMNDHAVLWTRSSDGRIIQMALGGITPSKNGYEFCPTTLIGTLP